MDRTALLTALEPVLRHLATLDLTAPDGAAASLEAAFPRGSAAVERLGELFRTGVAEGWLCDREAGGARFSRLAKAAEETYGFSIDAVQLSGPGVWHRHTTGEVDLCFAEKGEARFDGRPEGWVAFGAGSDHVPTVTGGTMNIFYFLPGGALEWKR